MKFRPMAALLAVATLSLAGCGDSESTLAPDTAPPLAPRLLNGYCKEAGKVVLNWAPNNEGDLAGYYIYEVAYDEPVGFAAAGAHSMLILTTIDGEVPYRMTAVDQAGNESAYSSTVKVNLVQPPTAEPADILDLK